MSGAAAGSLGLPRVRRLKDGRDFRRLRDTGQRLAHGCMILNWSALPSSRSGRLGIVTGRSVGNAVARSRARRLLREAYRLHQHRLGAPVDLVLVARPSIAGKDFAAVERDFLAALERARLGRPAS